MTKTRARVAISLLLLLASALACSFVPASGAQPTEIPVTVTALQKVAASNSPQPTFVPTQCVIASNALWLRTAPSPHATAVIALLAGTQVLVKERGDWLLVEVPGAGVTGFVKSKYVGECK